MRRCENGSPGAMVSEQDAPSVSRRISGGDRFFLATDPGWCDGTAWVPGGWHRCRPEALG
ncbi:arginine biosynthesis bifunctional ArgJ domain protein [Synechococcus sp. A15-62]|nr:arginine biosynthesis bifunctional ArgJ domain protein [Synechococcus sp. A15-62]